jgi:hypothetical protein
MMYLIKTIGGEEYEINEVTRNNLAALLTAKKEERPAFVELSGSKSIISTSSITSIVPFREEPKRLPTPEEEERAFQERWTREHGGIA